MKTAQEWSEILAVRVRGFGSLNYTEAIAVINEIRLESWRQGMTDAADLAEHGRSYAAAKYIREKRDATQSL